MFENVRRSSLAMDPLPPLNKVYYLVSQGEHEKQTLTSVDVSSGNSPNFESSAFAANMYFGSGRGFSNTSGSYLEKKEAAKNIKMDKKRHHCNQMGHFVDQCFKIYGYPY